MYKFIYLSCLLLLNSITFAQETNSEELGEKEDKNPKYASFGWANVIPTLATFGNNNTFKKTIQFNFNYEEETNSNTFLRFGLAFNSITEKLTTIRNYYFTPLIFHAGLGKKIYTGRSDIIQPYLDLFYTQSLEGARFGSGAWQGNNYGAGIVAGLSYIKELNEQWGISFDANIGGGLFREFKNIGTRTQMVLAPRLFSTRPFAINLRYRFQ